MDNDNIKEELKNRYTTIGDPIAYSGLTTVFNEYKNKGLSLEDVKEILSDIYLYPIHSEYKKPNVYNPFYIYTLRNLQIDTIFIQNWHGVNLKRKNGGYQYIILAIDGLSRRIFCVPTKRRDAVSIFQAVKSIIELMENKPPFVKVKSIFHDRGTEFNNELMTNYLRSKNIRQDMPQRFSTTKAAIAERANRSLQNLLYRYMTEKETYRWIDILQDAVDTYNLRKTRVFKGNLSPLEAELEQNKSLVLNYQLERFKKIEEKNTGRRSKFNVGDLVRIRLSENEVKDFVRRGYHENFSIHYFKVTKIHNKMPIKMYSVWNVTENQPYKRKLYPSQLRKITSNEMRIKSILAERVVGGQKQYYVLWKYLPNEPPVWINESAITDIFNNKNKK